MLHRCSSQPRDPVHTLITVCLNALCLPRCERIAEGQQMSQDGRGGIERVCLNHKAKPVVIATAVTRAAHCEVKTLILYAVPYLTWPEHDFPFCRPRVVFVGLFGAAFVSVGRVTAQALPFDTLEFRPETVSSTAACHLGNRCHRACSTVRWV